MKKRNILGAGLALGLMAVTNVNAQTKNENSDLQQLKAVVASHPDSLEAHQRFIEAFRKSIPGASFRNADSVTSLLAGQYAAWMKKYPKAANVAFAIGEAYADAESPKAKTYLLQAVKINPQLAKAWRDLAFDAERWGNESMSREYMGKAAAAAPDDPSYAFYHAMDFEHVDPGKWRNMIYDLAKRFPQSERGAQGLYWLGARSNDTTEKVKVFEQLKAAYPPEKFSWSSGGMDGLYNIYMNTTPGKALELATSLSNLEGWKAKDTLARKFISVHQALDNHQYQQAGEILRGIRLPRYSSLKNALVLLTAQAAHGAGNTAEAYRGLTELYAKEPTDAIKAALDNYSKLLGKNENDVSKDVWAIRAQTTKPAPGFNLPQYLQSGNASLEHFKGKVVLLTFWFPGCGPCRGEFPHFQNVINKFSKDEVVYVGINVAMDQDPYVRPFMKGTGYSFIPLRDEKEEAQKAYKVRGEPSNFLIDQHGQLVFADFRTDGSNEQTLELMIGSLLSKGKN
ncbi:TlpA disulfide reductase family protein [Chitinophaga sp. 212800010-3]|uniref:TlpA disulfide reductase family protein n=1 Tax=unclassified Chitinophaga TaxID=2619133 RepID=UPI002DF5D913|nr:redoxin domain-containing protein [Chitinophaga sp. 212800010-3]